MRNFTPIFTTLILGIVTAASFQGGINAYASTTYSPNADGEKLSESQSAIIRKSKISLSARPILDEFNQIGSVPAPSSQTIQLPQSITPNGAISPMSMPASVQKRETSLDAFIQLEPEGSAAMLEELGLEVITDLNDIVIVKLPLDRTEEIAALPWVKLVDFGGVCTVQNDMARSAGNLTALHNGIEVNGQTLTFDGTGVVCGMVDVGFDPNHVNFRNSDGESRIKYFRAINTADEITEYTPENISTFVTDDAASTHGTHVAGIMAGGFKDKANYIWLPNPDNTNNAKMYQSSALPYYGVATGADMAVAVGSLSDSYIVSSIDNIISYAESVGKPVVVNLSASSALGPHDGTDSFTKSLNTLAKRGVVCVAAGNDSNYPVSITKTFTESDNYVLTAIGYFPGGSNSNVYPNYCHGSIDIWTDDDNPVTIKYGIVDTEGNFTEWGSNNPENKEYHTSIISNSANFPTYFTGQAGLYFQVESYNNRFHSRAEFKSMQPTTNLPSKNYFCIYIEGTPGQSINMYTNPVSLFPPLTITANINGATRAYTQASGYNAINNIACGDNIISVGSYTSRTVWARLNGSGASYTSYPVGDITPFSGYGRTITGQNIPTLVAPGAKIISSYSTPFVNAQIAANPDADFAKTMTAQYVENDRTNYWSIMDGTSTSSPFVAGTIALWLQADPTLTTTRILELIKNSSTVKEIISRAETSDRWGYGLINAESGMRSILADLAGIGQVWNNDDQRLIINQSKGALDIFVAGETTLKVSICDIQGRIVASEKANSDQISLNTNQLISGIYIVKVEGNNSNYTRKLTL